MLVSKTASVTWNSRNKKHYCDLGYSFTKMKDSFDANVEDLTKGSQACVTVKCDYCGKEYDVQWYTYLYMQNKCEIKNDCCAECRQSKATDCVNKKYGGFAEMKYRFDDKRKTTNLERYGSENVFGSSLIKEKIVQTNLERYGVKYNQQSDEVRSKTIRTCMEKYGVDNYIELFRGKYIGANSPCWKGGIKNSRQERASHDYVIWRKSVFDRDRYTCAKCGLIRGAKIGGHKIELNAHHICNWKDNPDSRYDINNGITLCSKCHSLFHSVYGKQNNTQSQLEEFLNTSDEKVC